MATATNKPETEAKEKTVKVYIEKTREQQDDVFVSVNSRTWQIMRGVEVEVPECVAEQLMHQRKMQAEAIAFEEKATKPKNH